MAYTITLAECEAWYQELSVTQRDDVERGFTPTAAERKRIAMLQKTAPLKPEFLLEWVNRTLPEIIGEYHAKRMTIEEAIDFVMTMTLPLSHSVRAYVMGILGMKLHERGSQLLP